MSAPQANAAFAHAYGLLGEKGRANRMQAMLLNAQRLYDEGPGSLSPHLYWWRSGALALVSATVDPDHIEVRPDLELAGVLEGLPTL